jgi:L-threonylcarbamoyladenylate synthase
MTTDNRHKPLDIQAEYRRVFETLVSGGIVAMPTDTVYGLVAVAADRAAVERVYGAKARHPSQPMPVFVASAEQAELIAELNDIAEHLMQRFWPGALTVVLRKKPSFETCAVAGGDTIGLRAPRDPVLRELASQLGPLTGTSANIAGRAECHTAAEVRAQLRDAVDLIVDAPVDPTGRPSTIVDCTDPALVRLLREGAVARNVLGEALAGVAELV